MMQFKKEFIPKILGGTKTQTRRLVKDGDLLIRIQWPPPASCDLFRKVKTGDLRRLWCVDRTYAVQPGRGKNGVGSIRITGIRKENIQDISYEDIGAEGIKSVWPILINTAYLMTGAKNEDELKQTLFRAEFVGLWDHLYPKKNCWKDNPEVWVLDFELAND